MRPDIVLGVIDFFENTPGVVVKLLALLGYGHSSRMPDEKLRSEFFFELLNLLAQRRLGDPQDFRGTRKISAFCDLDKILELTKVHGRASLSRFQRSPCACFGIVQLLKPIAYPKT